MRTTVRIDDDLLRELKQRAERANTSLSNSLNQALRDALRADAKPRKRKRFVQKTHDMGPCLLDLSQSGGNITNAVIDALEDEEIIRKMVAGQ
jgi:hypothetical protein